MAPTATAARAGLILTLLLAPTSAKEMFTTNAVCGKRNCVNPVFPGVEDLHRLEASAWRATTLQRVSPFLSFCRGAINYDPALPVFSNTGLDAAGIIISATKKQDSAAMTMFFFHMAGLGYEGWDYPKPAEADDDCVKATWRMVCYTYFPRAQVGSQDGAPSPYLRPCQSSCQNYVAMCGVECCDESVQCVFEHTKALSSTALVTTTGYIPHDGPSSLCTGGAQRRSGPPGTGGLLIASIFFALQGLWSSGSGSSISLASLFPRRLLASTRSLALFALFAGLALHLQGCTDVPTHEVANWRGESDYLIKYEFIPPGGSARDGRLNSCTLDRLAQTIQCSGRGVCKLFDTKNLGNPNPTSFCECDRDWADPECRTKRKSQAVAFILSLVGGIFGIDQFYLGHAARGFLKLMTLGGCGVLWIADVIRVGSAPVMTPRFRVAADLPHWAFVIITVWFALFIGFSASYVAAIGQRNARRRKALLMQAEEDALARGELPFKPNYDSAGKGRPIGGPSGP